MKRVLCVLLVLVLMLGMTACSSKGDDGDSAGPLTPVGTYKPGVEGFYDIQSDLYDYFLGLLGFGHVTFTDENGDFADSELLQFAVIQLSYSGKNIDEGLTKREIDRTTTRYLGQKANTLEGTYLSYDNEKELYFPQNVSYQIGQLMALEHLTVQEDGICYAEFFRSRIPSDYFIDRNEKDAKQDFLSGWYEGLNDVQHIRMSYRERNTAAYGYYIEVLTIEQIVEE